MKMKTLFIRLIFFLCFVGFAYTAPAMSALEIMKKSSIVSHYAGNDSKSRMAMLVFHQQVKKPVKKIFTFLRKDISDGGRQKFFLYFSYPREIKRASFLVHKYITEDDLRRLYLPASNTVLMINGEQKQCAFMGSDFSAEDITGRHFGKDHHKFLREDRLVLGTGANKKNYDVFVIESISIQKLDKIKITRSWIDKATYLPVRKEFVNHANELFKVYEVIDIRTIDGYPTITRHKMSSILEGTYTVMVLDLRKTHYDMGIAEDLFVEASLQTPPKIVF